MVEHLSSSKTSLPVYLISIGEPRPIINCCSTNPSASLVVKAKPRSTQKWLFDPENSHFHLNYGSLSIPNQRPYFSQKKCINIEFIKQVKYM